MLRHFAYGYRDFRKLPDIAAVRYNWIIMVSFDVRKLHPRLDPPKKERQKSSEQISSLFLRSCGMSWCRKPLGAIGPCFILPTPERCCRRR